MDAKFFDGLFEGDSPNGVKLGMGLTGGDFWPRPNGCINLYRGPRWWQVDFRTLVAVADAGARRIVARTDHAVDAASCYVVQCVDGSGRENASLQSLLHVAFDAAGNVQAAPSRGIVALRAWRAAPSSVRLLWLYRPQSTAAGERFDVYSDGATGAIDFQNPVAGVACTKAGLYSTLHAVGAPGTHRFCVRRRLPTHPPCESVFITIEVNASTPQGVSRLEVKKI
ncbi:MAG: hypothetical protein IH624_17395 [Phycisphaerae bacterium]|nr:hypothetical protein [Phycisphaerae bacterium]